LLIVVAAVAVIVVLVTVFESGKSGSTDQEPRKQTENRLVVMYFENGINPNDEQRLGETASSLLITDLSQSSYLDVVSSQRVYDILKGMGGEGAKVIDKSTALRIAEQARAKWVLLGTIVQLRPQLAFSLLLLDVATGNTIASPRIETNAGTYIFPAVDELAVEVKKLLSLPEKALEEADLKVAEITTYFQEAYRNYLEGLDFFQQLRWTEAITSFRRAVTEDSLLAAARYYLAFSYFYQYRGEISPAATVKVIRNYERYNPNERLLVEGLDNVATGDYAGAVRVLNEAAELYPEEKTAFTVLGSVQLFCLCDPGSAIATFEQALKLDPYSRWAHRYLAYAYNEINQSENAIRAADEYLSRMPLEPDPFGVKADLHAYQGNPEDAIEAYRQALRAAPENQQYQHHQSLGTMYLHTRDYDKAKRSFRPLATGRARYVRRNGRTLLAWIPARQGKLDESLEELDRGIAADYADYSLDRSSDKYMLKALVYRQQGNPTEAINEIELALQILRSWGPNEYKMWDTYATLLADQREYGKASEIAESLRKSLVERDSPQMSRYWYALGYIALSKGQTDVAVDHLERASKITLRINGQYSIIHLALARAYLEAGRLDEAIAEFEKVTTICEPNLRNSLFTSIEARYYLGTAFEAADQKDKAAEQYRSFLEIWKEADEGLPIIEDARQRLAKLEG
jgi:tetratricopeptide (TPR) repeat protein